MDVFVRIGLGLGLELGLRLKETYLWRSKIHVTGPSAKMSLHTSDYLIDSQIPEFSEIFVSKGYYLQDGFNAVDYKMTENQLYRHEICAYSMQMEASAHS